ncbi:major facilitator superfamily domain-containing protein [Daldinia sp. FL1419]|nr:major facilitator superfamily domain-containing protein [Daldinia sp. FL1419]
MAQVFVVVVVGSVIVFIIRDLGDASIAGWIIQLWGPLLMQSVLSPLVGRLSDVLDRNYLATVPPLITFAGAIISAKATSMSMLIGGAILIGTTLATISVAHTIPSEILLLKFRALANGLGFVGGAVGGLMQAAFHAITAVGLFCFYWPPKHTECPKRSLKGYIWACDPVGSVLFVTYAWSNSHVAAPVSLGLVLLVSFATYEWRGRSDGLIAHYATRYKDLRTPLLVTFTISLVVTICYVAIRPLWSSVQLGLNVIAGIGQSGSSAILIACVQFTAPHAFLSTATGLAFSARAIGGAFGSAVLNAIINGRLASHYEEGVKNAAADSGLSLDNVSDLLEALAAERTGSGVGTATPEVWAAAVEASRWQYDYAHRLAWASVIPFVVLAVAAVALGKGAKDLMTEKIEAAVEHV